MNQFLQNCWYLAGWAADVAPEAMLARTIAGVPMVFWRGADGEVSALLDRCPHRFAPLSAGKLEGGTLSCGYHGLGFNGQGACVHNPHGPITSALTVRSFALVERHAAIWVWAGEASAANPALIPDFSFIDQTPEAARIFLYLPTRANYQLLSDNILDLSHADFLHASSLGGFVSDARTQSREENGFVVVEWEALGCTPPPAFAAKLPPGAPADIWHEVTWHPPGIMVLAIAAMPAGVPRTSADISRTVHIATPESETSTHYFVCNTRPFNQEDAGFTAFLKGALTHAFVGEDKPMLEAQQARIGTSDFHALGPALFKIDTASERARRLLARLIAEEAGAAG